MLTRTEFAVTRHGPPLTRIAAPLRSTMAHGYHPPKQPGQAHRGGNAAPAHRAERVLDHVRRSRRPLPTPAWLTLPARPIR